LQKSRKETKPRKKKEAHNTDTKSKKWVLESGIERLP
jgi:hypothetical protein